MSSVRAWLITVEVPSAESAAVQDWTTGEAVEVQWNESCCSCLAA